MRLHVVLCLVAALPGCGPIAMGDRATAGRAPVEPRDAALEEAVHDRVNRHRRAVGLAPLARDASIDRVARLHSAAMAAGRVPFGHGGFRDRANALGLGASGQRIAENVAYDRGHPDPGREVVDGWLRSPEHRKNIEGRYERTGLGAARNAAGEVYVTQLFVGAERLSVDSEPLPADGSLAVLAPSPRA